MATNSLAVCTIVAKEALAIIKNTIAFAKNVNRDYESEFESNQSRGYSPGNTVNIKLPPRFQYRAGRVASPQAVTETTIPLVVSQGGCDLGFTGFEQTLSLQQREKKIMAAVATVVNEIDRQGLDMVRKSVYNSVGTVGSLPTTQANALNTILTAQQKLDENGAPRDMNRAFCVNPAMNAALVQGLAGLFNNQKNISDQYTKGMMVEGIGANWMMDQNVTAQTNGTAAVSNINGSNQTGATITVNAITGTLKQGQLITLPGVNSVNPQSRADTGSLQGFVVTADTVTGATSIPISPAIVTSGAFQNVTASPTSGSPWVLIGTASAVIDQNVVFHEDAFTLAMVPMAEPPPGAGAVCKQMSDDGFTVKVTQYYDGTNDQLNMRLDVLFGWLATYPQFACKILK